MRSGPSGLKKAQFISRFKIDYNSIKLNLDSIFCNAKPDLFSLQICSVQLEIFKHQ